MKELNAQHYDKTGTKHYPMNCYPGNRTIETEHYRKFGERIPGDPMFGERPVSTVAEAIDASLVPPAGQAA